MAVNPNLARDITKVIEVKETSEPMRKLLVEIITNINNLEQRIQALENGN